MAALTKRSKVNSKFIMPRPCRTSPPEATKQQTIFMSQHYYTQYKCSVHNTHREPRVHDTHKLSCFVFLKCSSKSCLKCMSLPKCTHALLVLCIYCIAKNIGREYIIWQIGGFPVIPPILHQLRRLPEKAWQSYLYRQIYIR